MRISTKEERGSKGLPVRNRQSADGAVRTMWLSVSAVFIRMMQAESHLTERHGRNWNQMCVQAGDTIVFKDICRFTREYENGFRKYMELMERGIRLIFLDNPVLSTDYIRAMINIANGQENRIAQEVIKEYRGIAPAC